MKLLLKQHSSRESASAEIILPHHPTHATVQERGVSMAVTPELILIGVVGFLLLSVLFGRETTESREIIIVQPPAPRPVGCRGIIAFLLILLLAMLLVPLF